MSKTFHAVLLVLTTVFVNAIGQASADDRIDLPSRPGVIQPILFQATASPVASVVLFPGAGGGISANQGNFLIRVRDQFVVQGISVAVIDAPSDRTDDSNRYRVSAIAAADIASVVGFLKQKAPVPVWLVGTSRGSISAASGATRLGPPQVSGLILSSSVWNGGMQLVSLSAVAVPTLIIHNRDDGCRQSPASAAQPAAAMLTNAPVKELVLVSGGRLRGDSCGAQSPHGYYGIEDKVVPVMIAWIKSHSDGK
jgi:pimeloyl-ACP methyl ester carboxylesterase